jgi:hypothetical protein
MPSPPSKRPSPPAPDPNWERDLHASGGLIEPPESKDPLLAHALLHTEPEPLELFDDFADLERSTLPPPEAMSDHVARMMAEASRNEVDDDEGDRPTPLIEQPLPPQARPRLGSAPDRRDPTPSPVRAPVAERRAPAPVGAMPRREPAPAPVRAPVMERREPTPAPVRAPVMERRAPTPPPMKAPVMERRAPTPAPVRAPVMERRAPTPPPGRIPAMAEQSAPAAVLDRSSAPTIELDDLSDLPAVFGFALDDVAIEEPGSKMAIPFSEPAISPPFDSGDLRRAPENEPPPDKLAAIKARLDAGDFGRALVLAEAALDEHPGSAAVMEYAESCRQALYERYLERLGAADHVPRLAMQRSALTGLSLDHKAGFLLSCVDGGSTVEEIIDVSAMPRLDAVRLLYELLQEGIIEMAASR